jgi:pimeloyl-ACP methyl ester carboxylesterase
MTSDISRAASTPAAVRTACTAPNAAAAAPDAQGDVKPEAKADVRPDAFDRPKRGRILGARPLKPLRTGIGKALIAVGRKLDAKAVEALVAKNLFRSNDVAVTADDGKPLGNMRIYDWSAKDARARAPADDVAQSDAGLKDRDDATADARPTVIVLHGLFLSAPSHADLMRDLRGKCPRVVGIDLPGHGKSDLAPGAPLNGETIEKMVQAAIDHVLAEDPNAKVTIYGNSFGGFVAGRCAAARDANIDSVILASPAGGVADDEVQTALTARFQPQRYRQTRKDMDSFVEIPGKSIDARSARITRALGAMAYQQLVRKPRFQSLLSEDKNKVALTPAELAKIAPKTLLLWGGADETLPREYLEYFKTHFTPESGARVVEPEAFQHAPGLHNREQLLDYIVGHIDDVAARA